jgi:hypothetical protein
MEDPKSIVRELRPRKYGWRTLLLTGMTVERMIVATATSSGYGWRMQQRLREEQEEARRNGNEFWVRMEAQVFGFGEADA